MTIERMNPEFGYIDSSSLGETGMSQVVRAGGMVHWSGIVAAHGALPDLQYPAEDVAGQLEFVLQKIDDCLEAVGTDRHHIVTLTMFTTEMDGLSAALPSVFAPWAGTDAAPALTLVGVCRLADPRILLEIQGMAMMPSSA